jgi:hypothetical protein
LELARAASISKPVNQIWCQRQEKEKSVRKIHALPILIGGLRSDIKGRFVAGHADSSKSLFDLATSTLFHLLTGGRSM